MTRCGFFAVEGIPGVGKSMVAQAVARFCGGVVLSLPQSFRRFRAESDLDRTAPPLVRLTYYIAAIAQLAADIEVARHDCTVIADRYLASALAIFEAEGSVPSATIDAVSEPVRALLPVPQVTVVLTADSSTRRERSAFRAKPQLHTTPMHHLAASDDAFAALWQQSILMRTSMLGSYRVIDTSGLSAQAVVDAVGEVFDIRPTGPTAGG